MNQIWIDNLSKNLAKAKTFFGSKNWSSEHNQIWQDALCYYKPDQITRAFEEHYQSGKYMPKPAEIIDTLKRFYPKKSASERDEEARQAQEKQAYKKPDPRIVLATMIYQRYYLELTGWSVDEHAMSQNDVLNIVNAQAAKYNVFGGVRPDHRLDQFWGDQIQQHDEWWRTNTTYFKNLGQPSTGLFRSVSDLMETPKSQNEQMRELAQKQREQAA